MEDYEVFQICGQNLEDLKEINGISIAEIEDRGRPLEDSRLDKERYRIRSCFGFLDPQESFISRLRTDYDKTHRLKTSHTHLASELERLLAESAKQRKLQNRGPDFPAQIDFIYNAGRYELIKCDVQQFRVAHRSFAGAQWSFFRNLQGDENVRENSISWKEDHEIVNLKYPTITLTIAGSIGTGICHYIRNYGFFEGGSTNIYRIDPSVLHMVLTGIPSEDAIQSLLNFYKSTISNIRKEYEKSILELEPQTASSHDSQQINEFMSRLKAEMEEKVDEFMRKIEVVEEMDGH